MKKVQSKHACSLHRGRDGIIKEGYVTPGSHRDKKGRTHNRFVDMTDYILYGNIRDFCFDELRQHLPCLALFLRTFDDDEEKYDLTSSKTLIATDKVPVKNMIICANVDQQECGKELKINYNPHWLLMLTQSVTYGKDVIEISRRKTFHNHGRKKEQERESRKHEASEPADPPRKEDMLIKRYTE